MSNKASNHLFELIKSLSSNEKRYFKVFADRHHTHEKKNYLQLFDAIDAQKVYSEEAILQLFAEEPFVKHFSIAKNRLYHQILKSLDAYHAKNSMEAELNRSLHYAQILFEKALYSQCRKVLKSAEKTAAKYEIWGILLQIIKRQKRLAEANQYEGSDNKEINALCRYEQEILDILRRESLLWGAKSQIFLKLFQKGQARDKTLSASLKSSLEEIKKHASAGLNSFEGQYLALQAQGAYYFAMGKYPESFSSLKQNLMLVESNLDLIKDEPGIYLGIATNLVYVCSKLNKFDEAETYLQKTRNPPKKILGKLTDDLKLRTFTNVFSLELAVCNITGNVQKGQKILAEIERELPSWEPKLSDVRKAAFYHAISALYLICGKPRKALQWNNALLNTIPIDRTEDQYCLAQTFHMVIHIELGNFEVLPYATKSLMRCIETRKRQFKFESAFIAFAKAIQKSIGEAARKIEYEVFSEKMKLLERDPLEKTVFESFDYQAWAESKAFASPLPGVLQKKIPTKDIL